MNEMVPRIALANAAAANPSQRGDTATKCHTDEGGACGVAKVG